METPILMTEEYWRNTPLSTARFYGGCTFNGHRYVILNKYGMDLFECSFLAQKEGRDKAIEPGEPADLVLATWQPVYRKLGRDKIIELVKAGTSLEEAKKIAGIEDKPKRKRKCKPTAEDYEETLNQTF